MTADRDSPEYRALTYLESKKVIKDQCFTLSEVVALLADYERRLKGEQK